MEHGPAHRPRPEQHIAEAVGQKMDMTMTADLSYIFFTTLYICHIWIHTTFTTVQWMKENNYIL